MIRLLIAIGILFAIVAYWLTSASATDYDTDIDDDGLTNAFDINLVRADFGKGWMWTPTPPAPTPTLGPITCSRSYDGAISRLTGSGWPQDYHGAEVRWEGSFGEAFSTATVTNGQLSASYPAETTFAGVVGLDGAPYVCAD